MTKTANGNKSASCLLCGERSIFLKKVDRYSVLKCGECGLEFVWPMPSRTALARFYSTYVNFRADESIVALNARRHIELLEKHGLTPKSSVLDFGCGRNVFVQQGRSTSWCGYDPHNGHKDTGLLEGMFDFITLWGVLEHLADPTGELRRLVTRLRPTGRIALITVSTETGIPYQHKPPEHVTFWTERSMRKLFDTCGLKVVEYSPSFMYQDAQVYLKCVLNAGRVPDDIRTRIGWKGKKILFVPTNEVFVVGQRR